MFYLIFLYLIYLIYEISLSLLEINFVKKALNLKEVVLSRDDYKKAGETKIINEKFEIFSKIYSFFINICWIIFGLRLLYGCVLKENTILNNLIFLLSFFLINLILNLPLNWYEKFIKDKRLGFSNITLKIFILDFIKTLVLTAIFGSIISFILIICIKFLGSFWWVFGFLAMFLVVLITNLIYPLFIVPLFNKLEIIKDDDLLLSINELMKKAGFSANGIYKIDASKRDKRLNAYFSGLGKSKRVVLYDTLLQKLNKDEILAVLAHELGHFKNKDIIKNLVIQFVIFFIIFAIFGNLSNLVYAFLGIGLTPATIIVFMFLFMPLIFAFLMPLVSKLSRNAEFKADEYSLYLLKSSALKDALIKLGEENKAFPISHPLYSAIYHSHPTLFERINRLK